MNAFELFHKDGKPTGIYACGACQHISSPDGSFERAESCCLPPICKWCNKPIDDSKRYSSYHDECWKAKLQEVKSIRNAINAISNAMPYRHMATGTYIATKQFNDIHEHTAVCFEDGRGTLVAVTGPAGDAESLKYATLFAAAPELLNALQDALTAFGTESESATWAQSARAAIARAKGIIA